MFLLLELFLFFLSDPNTESCNPAYNKLHGFKVFVPAGTDISSPYVSCCTGPFLTEFSDSVPSWCTRSSWTIFVAVSPIKLEDNEAKNRRKWRQCAIRLFNNAQTKWTWRNQYLVGLKLVRSQAVNDGFIWLRMNTLGRTKSRRFKERCSRQVFKNAYV